MPPWYFFSILALVLLGSQRFLYKVAAERNCSSTLTTTVFMGTVTVLSSLVFFFSGEDAGDPSRLTILALVNSITFALSTIANMEALRRLPAMVAFPLSRLSILVVILFSLCFFDERLDLRQWGGIMAGLAAVFLLSREGGTTMRPEGSRRAGLFFIALSVCCGALASISSKLAAISVSKSGFMALSYLFATFFSLAIEKKWRANKAEGGTKEAMKLGLLMGILNFFGFYSFLAALGSGPLSVIALVVGMHFAIAIGLSVLLYREEMTRQRLFGIGLTLMAVYFLKR